MKHDFHALYRRPLQAIALLTRIPIRVTWEDDLKWGGLVGCFPLAGYIVGGISLAAAWAWLRFAPAWGNAPVSYASAAAALLVLIGAWLTGALHLDGWADLCDGCFASVTRERRLEIMSDPHLGGFGITSLILLLLLKTSAVSSMLAFADAANPPIILLVAPVMARWAAAVALSFKPVPLANPNGMAAMVRNGLTPFQPILATLLLAPVFILACHTAIVAAAVSIAAAAVVLAFARAKLGGLNGDVLGAIIEFSETVTLLVTQC